MESNSRTLLDVDWYKVHPPDLLQSYKVSCFIYKVLCTCFGAGRIYVSSRGCCEGARVGRRFCIWRFRIFKFASSENASFRNLAITGGIRRHFLTRNNSSDSPPPPICTTSLFFLAGGFTESKDLVNFFPDYSKND